MDQYQLPPWLMQAQPNYMQSLDTTAQMPMVQPQFNIQDGAGIPMQGVPMPQQSGMDAQKWASILGALAPMASRGQEGNGGYYMRMPEAQRMPGDPNYRPQWQLQFTPGQGLQMLSPMMRRR